MKLGIRTGATMVAVILIAAASLVYLASDRMGMAGKAAAEAREATLQTYRAAQALKSLIHGYELAINEYYSTALKLPAYQKKAAEFKAAIDSELATLEKLNAGDVTAVAELKAALGEIEVLRLELEGALSEENKDWELAREALYKLTVVSVRAAQPSELIARVAGARAVAMDGVWRDQQSQALREMQIAMMLALGAGALTLVGAFRGGRAPTREA
jgi:hypothetical protein